MKVVAVVLVLLIGLGAGFTLLRKAGETANESPLLNPLRKHHDFKLLRPFRPELQALIERLKAEGAAAEIAVYFRALNDGVWVGVNEKTVFAPASLMKVPLMLVYLKKSEQDPGLLERELTVEATGHFNQFIPSKVSLEKGKSYTVDKLLEVMITDSNNDAMRTLSRHADPEMGMKMYRQLGYTSTFTDRGDFLSLKTYAGTFRVLYNGSYLRGALSEKALRLLTRTDFDQGIAAGVPPGITVANKFGEYADPSRGSKQLHDVGIVYHHENPYILGIMTRGDDYEKLADAIKTISAFVYQEVDRQYREGAGPDFDLKFIEED